LLGTALCVRANHVTKKTINVILTVGISVLAELNERVVIIIIIIIIIIF
jgi:hypothetical protein